MYFIDIALLIEEEQTFQLLKQELRIIFCTIVDR